MALTLWRGGRALACRLVGLVRRRPVVTFVLWAVAALLPADTANVVQLLGPLVILLAFIVAGGRRNVRQVEAVARTWARSNGEVYKTGWFGWGIGASSRRGAL